MHWRDTGPWQDGTSVTGNGDTKIGLRYYDNRLGRWTQTDPLLRIASPGQLSEFDPYNYVGPNPVSQTDPTGAFSWKSLLVDLGINVVVSLISDGSCEGAIAKMCLTIIGTANSSVTLAAVETTSLAVQELINGGLMSVPIRKSSNQIGQQC